MRALPIPAAAPALACTLWLLGAATPSWGIDPNEIETQTLANGMKIVLWQDHSIPNLAMYTFFRVGSRNEDERSGETVVISAADPLNLVGIVLPGPRVPALRTNEVIYVDGVSDVATPAYA